MPEAKADSPVEIVFALPCFNAGGAERVLITLMNGLDRERFSPTLICLQKNGPLRDLVAPDIAIHTPFNFNKMFLALPFLWLFLIRTRPPILVSTLAHMNFAVLLAKLFIPGPMAIIVREAITPTYLINKRRDGRFIRALYRFLYPRAARVVCPAQIIIDEFANQIGVSAENCALLYNPVNIDRIRAAPPEPTNDNCIHFVCAGRLDPQKGFDRLIESLPFLNMNRPWHLTILGEGAQKSDLEALIKKNKLEDKVTLAGYVAAPWPHIAAADCFLLPSRHEGLPNVALESLCVGTPVIAMREAGGIGEIAALTGPNSVRLCSDMTEFIAAMESVTLHKNDGMRPSLLPDIFHPENVQKRFTEILDHAAA